MSDFATIGALVLAANAAVRLAFFSRFVRADTAWLDRVFGPMAGNNIIAREWSMTVAAGSACAALLLVGAR